MKQKRRILESVVHGVDLVMEPLPGVPLVELAGDKRVLIENHMGVTQYEQTEICVHVAFGNVYICGSGLELAQMTQQQLVITGCISCVRLCRREG